MARDRIKEFRTVTASELVVNERNFRTHPETQRDALAGILEEIGSVDVLKAIEQDGELLLIDGHLRQELAGDEEVRVAVLDLTPEEAEKVLLTFDRVTTMADIDRDSVADLIKGIEFEDGRVGALLQDWREELPELLEGKPVDNPSEEWTGMPEFEHENQESVQRIVVHFRTHEDAAALGTLLAQTVTEKTKSLWYPAAEIGHYADKEYASEGEEGEQQEAQEQDDGTAED